MGNIENNLKNELICAIMELSEQEANEVLSQKGVNWYADGRKENQDH